MNCLLIKDNYRRIFSFIHKAFLQWIEIDVLVKQEIS